MNEAIAVLSVGNGVGQLASPGQVSGDVAIVRGRTFEMFAFTDVRIKHNDLFLELIADGFNRTDLIRIARNDGETVGLVHCRIRNERDGEVHIGSFFFEFVYGYEAVVHDLTRSASRICIWGKCLVL